MTEQNAIEHVQKEYGSFEEFVYELVQLDEGAILDSVEKGEYSLENLSKRLDLPEGVIGRILQSGSFRSALSRAVAMSAFTISDEIAHVRLVADKATDKKSNISTLTEAYNHLRSIQERPLQGTQQGIFVPIQINVQGKGDDGFETDATTLHTPSKAGDLPPEGARVRYEKKSKDDRTINGVPVGSDLDFYSGEGTIGETSPFKSDDKS